MKIVVLDHEFRQMPDPLAKGDARNSGAEDISRTPDRHPSFGERKKRFHDSSKKRQREILFRFRWLSSDLVLPIAAGPEAELKDDGSQ